MRLLDFECHITVPQSSAEAATHVAKLRGWKTSEIARDPLLGDATYFYLTAHGNDLVEVMQRMLACSTHLVNEGVPVIREKIELIIHDTKVKP